MNSIDLKKQFSAPLLDWFDLNGRKDLPWKIGSEPYKTWISEIMLQQTQVQTVIPYFLRFIDKFPSITALAQAHEEEVLALWSGLGYYSRARNLHAAAQLVENQHAGVFPQDLDSLLALPGIGLSTAGAILSQAFNQSQAILDGNVKRVLCRFFKVEGYSEQASVKKSLWGLAQACMPEERCADYTQAIMDLGALCCKLRKPNCLDCPLKTHCLAFRDQEQHLYPTKKPKKKVPLKQEQMLVLVNSLDQIYLEKRPAKGIWGNLWSLPSLSLKECPHHFIEAHYDFKGGELEPIIAFKHKFSHFHLDIEALSIKIKPLGKQVRDIQGKWFGVEQIKDLGIAKPIHLILSKYFGI